MSNYSPKEMEKLCRLARLTEKEKTVFYLTCADVKQIAIGKQLQVSAAMIRIHMRHIYQKCDIAPQPGPRAMEKELIRQYGRFAPLVKENRLPVEDLPCDQMDLSPKKYPIQPQKRKPKEQKQVKEKTKGKSTQAVPPVPIGVIPTPSASGVVSTPPADPLPNSPEQADPQGLHRHPKRAHFWRKPPKKLNPGLNRTLETQPDLPTPASAVVVSETPNLFWESEGPLAKPIVNLNQVRKQEVMPLLPLPVSPPSHSSYSADLTCVTEVILLGLMIVFLILLSRAVSPSWFSQFPLLQQFLQP